MSHHIDFFNSIQRPKKTATEFLATLQKLAHKYGFPNLDKMLLAQFAWGKSGKKFSQKIFTVEDKSYIKAMRWLLQLTRPCLGEHSSRHQAMGCVAALHHQQHDNPADSSEDSIQQMQCTRLWIARRDAP